MLGMGVVLLEEQAHQLRGIESQVHRPQVFPQFKVSFAQRPFGEQAEILIEPLAEDRLANVEQIDPAVEFARPCLVRRCAPLAIDLLQAGLAANRVKIWEVSLNSTLRKQIQRS